MLVTHDIAYGENAFKSMVDSWQSLYIDTNRGKKSEDVLATTFKELRS